MKSFFPIIILFCTTFGVQAQTQPYQNPNLSAHERAVDLCSKLTLEEKAQQSLLLWLRHSTRIWFTNVSM